MQPTDSARGAFTWACIGRCTSAEVLTRKFKGSLFNVVAPCGIMPFHLKGAQQLILVEVHGNCTDWPTQPVGSRC